MPEEGGDKPAQKSVPIKEVTEQEKQQVRDRYSKVNRKELGCVDGRKPGSIIINGEEVPIDGVYAQNLGGSAGIATARWILTDSEQSYSNSADDTFDQLKREGYVIGVHDAEDRHGASCGCGYCENLRGVLSKLAENDSEIWDILKNAYSPLADMEETWTAVMEKVKSANLDSIPETGKEIVDSAVENHAATKQVLAGDHAEMIACVNLVDGYSLDTTSLVEEDGKQAFNLDVMPVLEQCEAVGLDKNEAMLLTLGMYQATEMVLVEDGGKPRLEIMIITPDDIPGYEEDLPLAA